MGCCLAKSSKTKAGRLTHHGTSGEDEEEEFISDVNGEKQSTEMKEKKSHKKDKKMKKHESMDDDDDTKHKRKHDENNVKLQVTIKSASNLRDADFMGHSDPYCVMEIPNVHHGKKKKKPKVHEKTQVIDDNNDPNWNYRFTCHCAVGDPLNFTIWDKDVMTDELLGRCTCPPSSYYPFGFVGELRLQDTGEETWAHLSVSVKVLEAPQDHTDEIPSDEKHRGAGLWAGLNFEEDSAAWKRAHNMVNVMEDEMGLQKEETNKTSLETLVRLAESGLPMPHGALERIVACFHSSDRRYRLAALMICKALGSRCVPFADDFGKLLGDNDEDVRAGACKVIGSFGPNATPYVDTIGKLLLEDEVPVVRNSALEALGLLSQADNLDALVELGKCLDHDDKRFRLATCLIFKSLGVKSTPHAYSIVKRIENDTSIDVRIAACTTLGSLGLGVEAVQPAIASLYIAEHDEDPRVARAASEALRQLKAQGRKLPDRPTSGIGREPPKPKSKAKAKGKAKEKPKEFPPKHRDSPRGKHMDSPREGSHKHKEKDKHKESPREGSHKHKEKDKHKKHASSTV